MSGPTTEPWSRRPGAKEVVLWLAEDARRRRRPDDLALLVVERCFNRLKQFRAVATRFDKLAGRYQAGLRLASLILWLREPASAGAQRPGARTVSTPGGIPS